MSSENEKTTLAVLVEGGLPQILAGPAGKAFSRLIGSVVDIPIAWMERISQGVRDDTAVISNFKEEVGDEVTAMALDDPNFMKRAKDSFVAKVCRRQANKEAIVIKAVEDLQDNPLIDDGSEPSDDFMNKFEGYAGDASSDDLRQLYAKLLVGEIRNAGSISPATLHLVSMLEPNTTQLINRVLPHAILQGYVYKDAIKPPLSVEEEMLLEIAGFWVANRSVSHKFNKNEGAEFTCFFKLRDELGLIINRAENKNISVEVHVMTPAGINLLKIINQDLDLNSLAEIFCKKGATKYFIGKTVTRPNNMYSLENPREILCPVPPAT